MNAWLVFLLTWIANVSSGAGVYAVARRHGETVTRGFLGRHIFTPNTVAHIAEQYRRHGTYGIFFSRLRAEFSRQNGQLTVREGVAKGPAIGGTIEGTLDYNANQVRMSGTFVPLYGVNNIFGQIPVLGLVLGNGNNEGLFAITYEVVGTPSAPVLRVNPISAIFPGVTRKIMEFNTGKQQNQIELPQQNNN